MNFHTVYFLAAKFAYNNAERGISYEYQTIFRSLEDIGTQLHIDVKFRDVYQTPELNNVLAEIKQLSATGKRVLVIYCPFVGSVPPTFLKQLQGIATTGVFFLDDTWRSHFVSSYIGSCDWFTSSDPYYQHRYKHVSASKPVYFPFGYDAREASKHNRPWNERNIDLSFVGANDAFRSYAVKVIADNGIKVECYGSGWPNGVISNTQFYDVLGRSKTSLNLSNSSCWDLRMLIKHPKYLLRNLHTSKIIEQFKARHLEVAALGACQLSYYSRGLEKILPIGSHVLVYPSIYEIPAIIRALSEDEMYQIGKAAKDHVMQFSYQQQFEKLLVNQ
jgi:spore maturation protein CgeB